MLRTTLALMMLAAPAVAHEWYAPSCCSGQDCAPVTPGHVQRISGGYRVTVEPGDHPMVRRPMTWDISDESPKLLPSQDADWHLCIGANTGVLFCVYKPEAQG